MCVITFDPLATKKKNPRTQNIDHVNRTDDSESERERETLFKLVHIQFE